MATYKVGADGKAPKGLSVGDLVVTGGGTYQITFVNPDGTYKSQLVDAGQTTYNTTNYSTQPKTTAAQQVAQATTPAQPKQSSIAAGTGASVSNPGQGTLYYDPATGRITRNLNGVNYYVDKGDEKYASIYAEALSRGAIKPSSQVPLQSQVEIPPYQAPDTSAQMAQLQDLINQISNTQYEPVNVQEQMQNTMTYEDAYKLARSIVEPQYARTYEETANRAAQNLDKAGLYRSLYGQALTAEAERDVTQDMNSAIGQLALNIQNNDWQKAAQSLQMIINEKQYAAGYKQNALSTAAQASLNYIDSITQQAQLSNNYALEQAGMKLKQEAYALEALYTQGQLSQMELENRLAELEIEAVQAERSAGYGGSGGGTEPKLGDGTGDDEPTLGDGNDGKPLDKNNLTVVAYRKLKFGGTPNEVLAWLRKWVGDTVGGQLVTPQMANDAYHTAYRQYISEKESGTSGQLY
ncbi:MAG: hypothetical protein ACOX8A_08275 [Thermacetogeniaceae bacterium]|jgi:hypothetical protein